MRVKNFFYFKAAAAEEQEGVQWNDKNSKLGVFCTGIKPPSQVAVYPALIKLMKTDILSSVLVQITKQNR